MGSAKTDDQVYTSKSEPTAATPDNGEERRYRHIKTGNLYTVESGDLIDATNSSDGRKMVLYRSLETGERYVRAQEEFSSRFEPCKPEACPPAGDSLKKRQNLGARACNFLRRLVQVG